MHPYTVKYKKTNAWFWKKINRVYGDGCMQSEVGVAYRWFMLESNERIEIPMDDIVFIFSGDRFLNVKENMELQAGQKIPTTAG